MSSDAESNGGGLVDRVVELANFDISTEAAAGPACRPGSPVGSAAGVLPAAGARMALGASPVSP